MNVFLAGTYSRQYVMQIYLAGPSGNVAHVWRQKKVNDAMDLFLSAPHSNEAQRGIEQTTGDISILESFIYLGDWMLPYIRGGRWDFLLDSGAFTFMSGNGGAVNWDEYVARYCACIVENKIQKFFELDIDVVTGLKHVERLRKMIEQKTGIQPIPVWHKSRGLDYWKGMVKDYKYVAIGGIVTKEIKPAEHRIFVNLIDIAKEHGAKVHGLGYTNLQGLKKYKFDSVDSTTWLYGNRSGTVYKFNGETIIQIDKPAGTRLNARAVAINNFKEWVKFQQYARNNL